MGETLKQPLSRTSRQAPAFFGKEGRSLPPLHSSACGPTAAQKLIDVSPGDLNSHESIFPPVLGTPAPAQHPPLRFRNPRLAWAMWGGAFFLFLRAANCSTDGRVGFGSYKIPPSKFGCFVLPLRDVPTRWLCSLSWHWLFFFFHWLSGWPHRALLQGFKHQIVRPWRA